jgi:hypothetical protein
MQSPHSPTIVDCGDGKCLVECTTQCSEGRVSDIPFGIGLPMFDRITAELLAENHRGDRRRLAASAIADTNAVAS